MGTRRGLLALALLALVVGLGSRGAFAQEATPGAGAADEGHPGDVRAGTCAGSVGDVVAPLNGAVAASGERVGSAAAIVAATSVTTVPLALTDLLAEEHALVFVRSEGEAGSAIACGEIGGSLDEAGDLAIGLKEVGGSGTVGVAFLSPDDADPGATEISVFLVAGVADTGGDGGPVQITPASGAGAGGATVEAGIGATETPGP
jgi:hypothetical protein